MAKRPVIGITTGLMTEEQDFGTVIRHRVSANYSEAVLAAGGLPIILPPQDVAIAEIVDLVDGLVFSGGADIDPNRYGVVDIHPTTYGISDERDRFELALLTMALERDLPVLCICRGVQVLNVTLGGTLIQDIPDQRESSLIHDQEKSGIASNATSHEVTLADGGLAAQVYGAGVIATNSFHHQALGEPAPGIQVEGTTSDGIIEAVSVPENTFVLGLQWHPEMLFAAIPEQIKPFEALIVAANARKTEPILV